MAEKGKYIKAKMWEDEWFMSLDNQERLIFIYLLTSKARVMSGIITASLSSMVDAINSKQAKEKYKEINRYIMKHNERPKDIPTDFVFYDEYDVEEILKNFEDKEKIIILKDNKLLMVNYYKNQDFDNQSMLQGVLKDIIDLVKSYGSFFTDKLENNKSFYNSLITKIEVMLRNKAIPREKMIDQDKRLVEEMVNLIRLIPKMFKETAILKLCLRYLAKNKLASNEDISELISLTNNTQSTHPVDTLPTPSGECPHNRIELNQTKTNQTKTNEIKLNNSLGLSSGLGTSSKNKKISAEAEPASNKIPFLRGRNFEDAKVTGEKLPVLTEEEKRKRIKEMRASINPPEKPKIPLKDRLTQEFSTSQTEEEVASMVIVGYFSKAFTRFGKTCDKKEISKDVIVQLRDAYGGGDLKVLEDKCRILSEYLIESEKMRDVKSLDELPVLLKEFYSKNSEIRADKIEMV